MVKGGVSFKKMGKGNKAKVKKYATVDFMQSCFYNLLEGLKIPSNSSGKAVLGYSSPNMDPSYPQKYTFYSQAAPTNHSKTSNLVFGQKRTKVGRHCRPKVVAPPRQHKAEDLFHEVFFGTVHARKKRKGYDRSPILARRIKIFRIKFCVIIFAPLFFKTSENRVPTKLDPEELDWLH